MPHSSGGGSHGGGSHGGGHGGGSRGSGGSRSVKRSKNYFPGSHRYVYYHHHRPVYFYREKAYTKQDKQKSTGAIIGTALFLIFIYGMFLVTMVGPSVHFPKKISAPYNSTIQIVDELGLIGEEYDAIYQSFENFRDDTGVVPALLIIPNSAWESWYVDLESYAYDYYVNHFEDEKHWLIVYSTDEGRDFEDWYWEGMQGDDTDPVITEAMAHGFTSSLQRRLTDRTHYSIGRAITAGFDELDKKAKSFFVDYSSLPVVPLVFILFHACFMFWGAVFQPLQNNKLAQSAVELETNKQYIEDTCLYCGGVYIHGIHLSCPHCAAPIRPAGQPIEVSDDDKYNWYN